MYKETSCSKYLKEQGIMDLSPRLRCISCSATVAQLYNRGKGRYNIEDGEWIDCDGSGRYTPINEDKQGWMCGPCIEYEEAEPNCVVVLYGEHGEDSDDYQRYTFRIGSHAIIEVDDDEIPGDLFEQVIRPYAQQMEWHPSDPWRGHYASNFEHSWIKVIDDWFGTVDGHNCDRGDQGKFYELYGQQKQIPSFPMMVCFPRTSNVCACGISVFVPKLSLADFKSWLGVDELGLES